MEEIVVGQVIISKQEEYYENYQRFRKIVKEKNIKVLIVEKCNLLEIEENVYIDILWPNESNLIRENCLNNNSIVCKICYNDFSMLFTGDIEEIAERHILQKYSDDLQKLRSTLLKVGHHGSKTSSIQEFINVINPKIALIGVGKNNKFGHPNKQVIDRLQNNGVKVFRTDLDGEVSIFVDRNGKMKIHI